VVPWCETSRRGYTEQEDEIIALAGMWKLDAVMSEAKGVGIPPTKNLRHRLTRTKVVAVKTTQDIKEQAYARLQNLLAERSIVLPDHAELRKQLAGIVAKPTPLGGLRIEARTQSTHDDLADALAFAVWGLPEQLADPPELDFHPGTQWAQTSGGIRIPLPVATVRAELSYADVNGGFVHCSECRAPYPAYRETCTTRGCTGRNPGYDPEAPLPPAVAPVVPAGPVTGDAVSAGNQYNPDLMRCPAGHLFDGRYAGKCPKCNLGAGGARSGPRLGPFPGALPPGLATRLGGILGPRY